MSEPEEAPEKGERKRDKFNDLLQKGLDKSEAALKHAIGLGNQPNAVPVTEPRFKERPRAVEVGWHPVGGGAGKWLAEDTGLGKMITEKIKNYPDPTQHWAVLVGDYAHQLWMDEDFHVIYVNEKVKREDWRTFSVGETRFNDDAIRRTGESVIHGIRDRQPVYNLITNNCQTYALQLLDAIKAGGGVGFGTTLAIYERLVGPGKVADLFVDQLGPEEHVVSPMKRQDTVLFAQEVMDSNTTQIDAEREMKKQKKEKKGIMSLFKKKKNDEN